MAPTIDRMIRIQFQKARNRGYADNFAFADECQMPKFESNERGIVRINATDDSFYHLTDRRILSQQPSEEPLEITRYKSLKSAHWVTEHFQERRDEKSKTSDRIILFTRDKERIQLDNLGDSFQPLLEALQWYIDYQ